MAQNVTINKVNYEDVSQVKLPLTSDSSTYAVFMDTSDATATAAQILSGATAYVKGAKVTGSIATASPVTGTISTKAQSVSVPAGYYTAASTVSISATEQAKIIAENIKAGVTILGVTGSSDVTDTTISSTTAATAADIISGKQAYVNGALLTGTHTDPTFSLSSGILTIS